MLAFERTMPIYMLSYCFIQFIAFCYGQPQTPKNCFGFKGCFGRQCFYLINLCSCNNSSVLHVVCIISYIYSRQEVPLIYYLPIPFSSNFCLCNIENPIILTIDMLIFCKIGFNDKNDGIFSISKIIIIIILIDDERFIRNYNKTC